MSGQTPAVLLDGLQLPECPRWHDGRLWFADMFAQRVMTVDLEGHAETVAQFDTRPSGIGFLPDGRAVVVLYYKQQLMRLDPGGGWSVHADLTSLGGNHLNDMIIDGRGDAYVGLRMRGRSIELPDLQKDAVDSLIRVAPNGEFSVAAAGMITPNGLAISGDGKTLVVAESRARRLKAFAFAPGGELSDGRVHSTLNAGMPDGLCMDAEGAVWVATVGAGKFVRLAEGGRVLDSIDTGGKLAIACTLGGPDRRTLFMMVAKGSQEQLGSQHKTDGGLVETLRVPVAGAGLP